MTTGQRIRMESRELGRTEARIETKAETLIRLLQRRFGPLPQSRREQIAAASVEQLDQWTDRLLDAASCDDVFASA